MRTPQPRLSHSQSSPHGHDSPHKQPVTGVTFWFWQPQLHAVPAQVLQPQPFAIFFDI